MSEKENWKEMSLVNRVLYVLICLCFAAMLAAVVLQTIGIWPDAFVAVRALLAAALFLEGIRNIKKKMSTTLLCFAVGIFILVLAFAF